jgi:hypothetical protein
MPVIHLMDGEKGGTGKSWVARTTVQGYTAFSRFM